MHQERVQKQHPTGTTNSDAQVSETSEACFPSTRSAGRRVSSAAPSCSSQCFCRTRLRSGERCQSVKRRPHTSQTLKPSNKGRPATEKAVPQFGRRDPNTESATKSDNGHTHRHTHTHTHTHSFTIRTATAQPRNAQTTRPPDSQRAKRRTASRHYMY